MRAGITAKQRLRRIPVVFGSERERTTQFYYSDQKLPYYHNVNKRSNLGSNAKNLIAVHRTSLKSLEICRTHEILYPPFKDKLTFADEMGSYFIEKIDNSPAKLDDMASGLSSYPPSSNCCLRQCSIMDSFSQLSENDVRKLMESSAKKPCKLDPMSTPLVVNCIDPLLPVITKTINLLLSSGYFSDEWKCAIFNPLLRKPGLDLIFKSIDLSVIFITYLNSRKRLYMNKSIFTWKRTISILYSSLRTENSTVQKLLF